MFPLFTSRGILLYGNRSISSGIILACTTLHVYSPAPPIQNTTTQIVKILITYLVKNTFKSGLSVDVPDFSAFFSSITFLSFVLLI